jgi:membrane associated rhomboid family serine protease
MTPTPVGMRCPECAKQRTKVRNLGQARGGTEVTKVLIAINVIAFIAELSSGSGGAFSDVGGSIVRRGALFGPSISIDHEYYRLITSGFLHAGFLHIAFNMYLLWIIGQLLEPAVGPLRFAAIYATALLAGSFGALVVAPDSLTVGASGAVFGLMGAAFLDLRHRGFDPMQSGIGALILFNLVLSFVLSNVSWGGHVGGLIGGSLAALVIQFGDRMRSQALGLAGCVALSAVAVAGAIAAA